MRLTEAAPGSLFSGPATAKAVATRRSAFRFRQWASIIGPVPANFGKHSLTKIVNYSRKSYVKL
jgi:hypothetical protein